jgi:hypothetical protein
MKAPGKSEELKTAIGEMVQLFVQYPELKFKQLTEQCCKHMETELAKDPTSYSVATNAVAMRLSQFIRIHLVNIKKYTAKDIAEFCPGYLDNFLNQEKNQEKRKQKKEQLQQSSSSTNLTLQDELADAFSGFGEEESGGSLPSPVSSEQVVVVPSKPTSSRKKRKLSALESATTPVVVASETTGEGEEETNPESETMEQTLHRLTETRGNSTTTTMDVIPLAAKVGLTTVVHQEVEALDSVIFVLHNSIHAKHRVDTNVTTIIRVVITMLQSLKQYFASTTD